MDCSNRRIFSKPPVEMSKISRDKDKDWMERAPNQHRFQNERRGRLPFFLGRKIISKKWVIGGFMPYDVAILCTDAARRITALTCSLGTYILLSYSINQTIMIKQTAAISHLGGLSLCRTKCCSKSWTMVLQRFTRRLFCMSCR